MSGSGVAGSACSFHALSCTEGGLRMKPTDRFLAAINRQMPDRVPKFAEFTPGLMEALKERTGCEDPAEYFSCEMRDVRFHPTRLRADFSPHLGELPPGSTIAQWGWAGTLTHLHHLTRMVHPMRGFVSVEEIEGYPLADVHALGAHSGSASWDQFAPDPTRFYQPAPLAGLYPRGNTARQQCTARPARIGRTALRPGLGPLWTGHRAGDDRVRKLVWRSMW